MCYVQSQSLCHPLELASVQFSQCCFWESAVSCNTYPVYLTCAMAKREKERWSEIFCCQMESSGFEFRDSSWAATQPQYDITLPSVLSGETIRSELVLCVSAFAYTLTGTLQKLAGKSPLDYYETVSRLNVVTKQHSTLFTSLKCQACFQMANWKQRHSAGAIVLRRLWTAKN